MNGIRVSLHRGVGQVLSVGGQSSLGRYHAQLEMAEANLRAALDEGARVASAIREIEAELRREWGASYGEPPPATRQLLGRLRNERAALTEAKHEAQRAAEEAGLQVASARRAIEATEERARRLRRQLMHEADAGETLRRAIVTTEQSLARQHEALEMKEAFLARLHDDLIRLAGEEFV